jgi:hypothetical protein
VISDETDFWSGFVEREAERTDSGNSIGVDGD